MDTVLFRRTRVIASNKWLWLLNCWRSRVDVLSLLDAADREPVAPTVPPFNPAQSEEIDSLRSQLQKAKEEAFDIGKGFKDEIEQLKHDNTRSQEQLREVRHQAEDQQAAHKLAMIDASRKHADEVLDLKKKLGAAAVVPSKDESKWLKEKLKLIEADLQLAKDGNRALLRFINVGHRLRVKLDPGTIQAALRKG